MLDEDEVKAYEDWKERKLKSSVDLSVSAFNIEQEAAALAWEHGFKASVNGQTIESNPHRRPGMKGHREVSETHTFGPDVYPGSNVKVVRTVNQVEQANKPVVATLQSFNDGEPDSGTVLRPKNFES